MTDDPVNGVAKNLIWGGGGIRFNWSLQFQNVPHLNKTVTDFLFGGVYIPIYPPSLRPWTR